MRTEIPGGIDMAGCSLASILAGKSRARNAAVQRRSFGCGGLFLTHVCFRVGRDRSGWAAGGMPGPEIDRLAPKFIDLHCQSSAQHHDCWIICFASRWKFNASISSVCVHYSLDAPLGNCTWQNLPPKYNCPTIRTKHEGSRRQVHRYPSLRLARIVY